MKFYPAGQPLKGRLSVPGDKSISHRSVMLGAVAEGTTQITGFLKSADCLSTIDCFRKMGISITEDDGVLTVEGKGLGGLCAPSGTLDCGNSGTTTRLLSGLLAGQTFSSRLTGDASIRKRPMKRVIEPLTSMGADIRSENEDGYAPLLIRPSSLHGIVYHQKVASAQVKSAILLAGLYADSPVTVVEPARSRDHTERMLRSMGAKLERSGAGITIWPDPVLRGAEIHVPGDISSAAYFIAAALIVPGSEITLPDIGINPTRTGILDVVKAMGGDLTVSNVRTSGGEERADLKIRSSRLSGCTISGDLIPRLIDELPVIAVMAACAGGTTVIRDAGELRVKESDRLAVIVDSLAAMGADITATEDGMIIRGGRPLHGATIDSHLDHRIAMSFAVAALAASGETDIRDADCARISYPGFYSDLESLVRNG